MEDAFQNPHRLARFALWPSSVGPGGSLRAFRKRRDALVARTPGTNEPAAVVAKTTKAELDRLGAWARGFR